MSQWHWKGNETGGGGRTKAGERREGKIPCARLVRGPKILVKLKTSIYGCDCQEGWGPVMCNHLLVAGPDRGSRQP